MNNKGLLYKEAGGKESARREKYINQLITESGKVSMLPNKDRDAFKQGLFNTSYGNDAFGIAGTSPNYNNNSATKLGTTGKIDMRQKSNYRNSSLPDGEFTLPESHNDSTSKGIAVEKYNKRIFAVPRIDLTQSFKGYDSTNPWSYKSENIPSAIYVQRRDHQHNEYLIEDQAHGSHQPQMAKKDYSLISATDRQRPTKKQKMMIKKKRQQESQQIQQDPIHQNLPALHVHTSTLMKAQQSLLQSTSPKRSSNTREMPRKERDIFNYQSSINAEQKIAEAFSKILGKQEDGESPPIESERYKRRQRSPNNLGMYLEEDKLHPGKTLAENLFRSRKQQSKQKKKAHFSVDFSNNTSVHDYSLTIRMSNNPMLVNSVQQTGITQDSVNSNRAPSNRQGIPHSGPISVSTNPDVLSPIKVSQRDQNSLFSAGGQSRRARMNKFGNYFDEDGREIIPVELNDLPSIARFAKKDGHIQNLSKDLYKYYFQPQIPKKSVDIEEQRFRAKNFLTASNHYKYNRIREGGWGKKRPLNLDSNIGHFDSQMIEQIQRRNQNYRNRNAQNNYVAVTQKVVSQKHKLLDENYHPTQRLGSEVPDGKVTGFQQPMSVVSSDQMVLKTKIRTIQGQQQQIFESVDDSALLASRERNKTMLQDSIIEMSQNRQSVVRDYEMSSPITNVRHQNRSHLTTGVASIPKSTERSKEQEPPLLEKSRSTVRKPRAGQDALNQYNSKTGGGNMSYVDRQEMEGERKSQKTSPSKNQNQTQYSSDNRTPMDPMVSKSFNIRDIAQSQESSKKPLMPRARQEEEIRSQEVVGIHVNTRETICHQNSLKTSKNQKSTALDYTEQQDKELSPDMSPDRIMQEISQPQIQLTQFKQVIDGMESQNESAGASHDRRYDKEDAKEMTSMQDEAAVSPTQRSIVFQQFDQQQQTEGMKKATSQRTSIEDIRSKENSPVARSTFTKGILFENAALGKSNFRPGKKKHSRGQTRQRGRHSQEMTTTNTSSFNNPLRQRNFKEFNFDDVQPLQPMQMDFMNQTRRSSITDDFLSAEQFKINSKLKDLKTIRHLQHLRKQSIEMQRTIEREEKKSIFDRVADTKNHRLIAGYAHQGLQEQIQQNRKIREKMMEHIAIYEKKIKERRREIERQKEKNAEAQEGFEHQLDLLARLNNMEQVVRKQESSALGSQSQTQQSTTKPSILEFNQSANSSAPGNSSQDGKAVAKVQTKKEAKMIDVGDIMSMYKHLFENDLNWTKNRALDDLVHVREKQFYCQQESEHLKQQSVQLKTNIARYKKMIKELEQTEGPLEFLNNPQGRKHFKEAKSVEEALKHSRIIQSGAEKAKIQDDMLKQEMDSILVRQSERGFSPPIGGPNPEKLSQGSPTGGKKSIKGTPMTTKFSSKAGGHPVGIARPIVLDIKKLEMITIAMPMIVKQRKPLDQLVLMLQMAQRLFKTQKINLFLTDMDLANKVLSYGERKHNYKKVQLESSNAIAIFTNHNNFVQPLFFDNREVQAVFNNKQIIIPLMDPTNPRQVQLVLQVTNDDKSAAQSGGSQNANQGSGGNPSQPLNQSFRQQVRHMKAPNHGGAAGTNTSRSNLVGDLEEQSLRSGSQFVAGKFKRGTSNTNQSSHQSAGFAQNDRIIAKILTEMMQMTALYFYSQVQTKEKIAKIDDVIKFAESSFEIRTYRQIIAAFKKNVEVLIGFQTCTIFFDNQTTGDLFTLTTEEEDPVEVEKRKKKKKEDPSFIDTSFAKELVFPENEVIECPASMGVSGEVHQRMGIRFENNFGQLIPDKPKKQHGGEDDFENRSESSSFAGKASVITKSSGIYQKNKSQPSTRLKSKQVLAHQNTKLEQIKEDVQYAEEDQFHSGGNLRKNENNTHMQTNLGSHSSLRVKQSAKSQMDDQGPRSNQRGSELNQREKPNDPGSKTYTVNFNESKLKQRGGDDVETYIQTSEHSLDDKGVLNESRLHQSSPYRQSIEDVVHDGLDIESPQKTQTQSFLHAPTSKKRAQTKNRKVVNDNLHRLLEGVHNQSIDTAEASTSQNVTNLTNFDPDQKYYNQFIPDIDNFEGVKDIRNYCVCSQRENGYGFGDRSVGIVQVFNRMDGRPIDQSSLRRIHWFARFVGALTERAAAIRNSFTLIIGMMHMLRESRVDMKDVDPDGGDFNTIMLQMDIIWKPTTDLELNAKDQDRELKEAQKNYEECKQRLQAMERERIKEQDNQNEPS